MSKLDEYARLNSIKTEFYLTCVIKCGRVTLGPTNKGGIWLKYDKDGKEIAVNDIAIKDLKEMRDGINYFLTNICGEE